VFLQSVNSKLSEYVSEANFKIHLHFGSLCVLLILKLADQTLNFPATVKHGSRNMGKRISYFTLWQPFYLVCLHVYLLT